MVRGGSPEPATSVISPMVSSPRRSSPRHRERLDLRAPLAEVGHHRLGQRRRPVDREASAPLPEGDQVRKDALLGALVHVP